MKNIIEEYANLKQRINGALSNSKWLELLPIAVSRDDMDLFVIVVGGSSFGQVIWFAGGIIERFDSIKSFLSGMMGYSKADMKDLLN